MQKNIYKKAYHNDYYPIWVLITQGKVKVEAEHIIMKMIGDIVFIM